MYYDVSWRYTPIVKDCNKRYLHARDLYSTGEKKNPSCSLGSIMGKVNHITIT